MRTRLLSLVLSSLLLANSIAAQELQPWKGDPIPTPIELNAVSSEGIGPALSLADFKGRVVLVNFWATWCGPCIEEMPALELLREGFKGEAFEVLAVNNQEGTARISGFLKTMDLDLPVVRDTDGAVARAWKVRIFPTSFVVDPEGRVRYMMVGTSDWTSASVKSKIRALLPVSKASRP